MARRDEDGIIGAWLVKILFSLAVCGATLFEAGAIVVATVGVDGTADVAAREAALEYGRTKNEKAAREIAERSATQGGGVLQKFTISSDRKTVSVTVVRHASTKIVQHIEPLKKYTITDATSHSPIR